LEPTRSPLSAPRYTVRDCEDDSSLIQAFFEEGMLLLDSPPGELVTTMLILPFYKGDITEYYELYEWLTDTLEDEDGEEVLNNQASLFFVCNGFSTRTLYKLGTKTFPPAPERLGLTRYIYTHEYVCIHMYIYIYIHIRVGIFIFTLYKLGTKTFPPAPEGLGLTRYIYTHTHIYVYIYVCIYI